MQKITALKRITKNQMSAGIDPYNSAPHFCRKMTPEQVKEYGSFYVELLAQVLQNRSIQRIYGI